MKLRQSEVFKALFWSTCMYTSSGKAPQNINRTMSQAINQFVAQDLTNLKLASISLFKDTEGCTHCTVDILFLEEIK